MAQGTRQIHNRNNLTKQLKTLKKGEISVIHRDKKFLYDLTMLSGMIHT